MDIRELTFETGGLRPKLDGRKIVKLFPYVNNQHQWTVWDRHGPCVMPYGFLSDGASGPLIADLTPTSWFPHDWRYLTGKSRPGVPCTKREADVTYAVTLFSDAWDTKRWARRMHLYVASLIRCSALGWGGHRAWNTYRALDEAKLPNGSPYWTAHMLPCPSGWELPTMYTKDAIWRGCA